MGLERLAGHYKGNPDADIRQEVIALYHKISRQGFLLNHAALANLIQEYKERLQDAPFSPKEYKALDWLTRLRTDVDGRLRTPIRPYHSVTGRAGLLGTTPINGYKVFREKLLAAPGGSAVYSIDYAGCEVGILAALSGDKRLCNDYMGVSDLYSELIGLAHTVCGLTLERGQLKRLLLMSIYGASPRAVASKLRISEPEAKAVQKAIMEHYPTAFKWLEQQTVMAYQAKVIQSRSWQIHVSRKAKPAQVRNWPIQMAGMEIINKACLIADQKGLKVVGVVHDCIYIESKISRFEQEKKILEESMVVASEALLDGFQLKTNIDFITKN
ncbi:DNA polymerase I [Moritella viscosa]|uniref:DNA polymerase I n=1 Tax=Moritella viscosa TaxID=80854 RepID=A0ABY1HKH7_9GAMM|nr:DNA polymerase I [Moritella viscosa]SGZ03319.1 DNA polymerase I [Moritella viscosa]SHO23992.1 DNA polymerase I [Moritella viscosa]